ncbi:pyridoxal phosphate-dependent aminotransferase [Nannocystis bainbridge]|uniref:Pyridoxal phosphate-dependent aminotransferase n=1 Tax=Nannocystis bainbridge TaxID=2995303 RepID=A0ABT5DQL2_9BACT|nr:pyridoxal phosphate-dependent aminotransferase [Nannocystis bainbridge]MDC0715898.1 pyridoxal phosphate-dependent aminotransferase [Nannocystis bainbridge]
MFSRRTAWPPVDDAPLVAPPGALDLTVSNPTAVGLSHPPDFWASLGDPGSAAYDPDPLGLLQARAAVADYYRARAPGLALDLADICLLAGTSEAYAHLLAVLCDPGDVVLVPQPGYPLLPMIADLAHVELRPYPLLYDGTWSIDQAALAAAVCPRTRAIVLVAPNNPTGNYLAADELAAVDALAAAHGLGVLVDEVFFDYPIGHVPGASPLDAPRQALTFVLSGLSKVAALPQLKLAWAVARGPQALVREAMRRLELVADTYLSLATPVQRAAATLLAAAPAMQAAICRRVRANLDRLRRACIGTALGVLDVEAGWTALVRMPHVLDDGGHGWARELARVGVLTQPGELYELPPAHLALSLITPEPDFADGLERITEHVAHVLASAP